MVVREVSTRANGVATPPERGVAEIAVTILSPVRSSPHARPACEMMAFSVEKPMPCGWPLCDERESHTQPSELA